MQIVCPAGAKPENVPISRSIATAAIVGAAVTAVIGLVIARHLTLPARSLSDLPSPVVATSAALPWDQSHRADLLKLESRADELAIAGEWKRAHSGYQQILELIADHDVSDPVAADVVAAAQAGQDRVMGFLLDAAKPVIKPLPLLASATPVRQPAMTAVAQPASPAVMTSVSPIARADIHLPAPSIVTSAPAQHATTSNAAINLKSPSPRPADRPSTIAVADLTDAQDRSPSDLGADSSLADPAPQTSLHRGDSTDRPFYYQPPSLAAVTRVQQERRESGWWKAWITGPVTDQTYAVKVLGHTFSLGGLNGPRSISGVWSGIGSLKGGITINPVSPPPPPAKPGHH